MNHPLFRFLIWFLIFNLVMSAGSAGNIGALILAIIFASYWFWRYPPFKKEEDQED
jgi:hypothetical protein